MMNQTFHLSLIPLVTRYENQYNLTTLRKKLFPKRNNPCQQEFPKIKLKGQILDHSLQGISNITSKTAKLPSETQKCHTPSHRIQTDDIELDLSQFFAK